MTRRPHRPRPRPTLVLAAGALAAATLTACTSGGPEDPPEPTGRSSPADDDAPGDGTGDGTVDAQALLRADGADGSGDGAHPADVLGPGIRLGPVPDAGLDVAATVAVTTTTSTDGAVAAAAALHLGLLHGATTGDRTLIDAVSGPTCGSCRSIADDVAAQPLRAEQGYRIEMTAWPLEVTPVGDAVVQETVLHVLTTFEDELADGTPHLLVVQDEAFVLTSEMRHDGERWTVAGVRSEPWDARPADAADAR